jgi:hypothetical protein
MTTGDFLQSAVQGSQNILDFQTLKSQNVDIEFAL